jgi:maltooligosyltrehalose trehalohydrolase
MKMSAQWSLDVGARYLGHGACEFRVWAPSCFSVELHFLQDNRVIAMAQQSEGYFIATQGIDPGKSYYYRLNGATDRPDPASRAQPEGVHGPSMVVDPTGYEWNDREWRGLPLLDFIVYELHVGTFSKTGTFDGVLGYLRYLRDEVGITALELMPVGQFPGSRNWGYDGTYLFSPQWSYGGPDGLKRLVDACHAEGLAVILDVVYNHLGPEGNYLKDFGPYFTDRYRTPWGDAINYDGPNSDPVRHFVISNALYWITEYHIDALRLDAVHGIYDFGAHHILQELSTAVHWQAEQLGRKVYLIAETDLNDTRIISSSSRGGYGIDAQWNDDFHHALHVEVTGEHQGYYEDFDGLTHVGKALQSGYVYTGQHSRFRHRKHGNDSVQCSPCQFMIFAQNHDQIGNRARGDRLSTLTSLGALRAVAATVLLAPQIPMLFMGEEYAETAPFQYFTDHGEPTLAEAVKLGRQREFAPFGWSESDIPDPQALTTFKSSRIDLDHRTEQQSEMLQWVASLIDLRKRLPALASGDGKERHHQVTAFPAQKVLVLTRWHPAGSAMIVIGFNARPATVRLTEPVGNWTLVVNSPSQEQLPRVVSISPKGFLLNLDSYQVGVFQLQRPSMN